MSSLTTRGAESRVSLGKKAPMSPLVALLWKQFFDLSYPFLILCGTSSFLIVLAAWLPHDKSVFYSASYGLAAMFTCFFALAACFTLFVTEAENRTREFLGNLPLSSFLVGVAKQFSVISAIAAFFGLQLLLRLIVLWVCRSFFDLEDWGSDLDDAIGLYNASIIVIGFCLGSLVCCSYWTTSWLSVSLAVPLSWLLCVACFSYGSTSISNEDQVEKWTGLVTTSRVVLAIAIPAAILIPLFWLRRRPLFWKQPTTAGLSEHSEENVFWTSLPGKLGIKTPKLLELPGRGRFPALLWQSIRQQAMMPFLGLLAIAVMAWFISMVFKEGAASWGLRDDFEAIMLLVLTMTGYGFGAGALYRDKLNSNLCFFQQHREHGRELLLARILFPMFVLLATALLTHFTIDWLTGAKARPWLPLLSGISAFSAALMWSMAFRSHIYALALGLVLSLTMSGFLATTWQLRESTENPHRWMVVLPIVWLATCLAYAPRWLSGRRSAAWMVWFAVISLVTYSVPLWNTARWILGWE